MTGETLELRHINDPEKNVGMTICVKDEGQPNCKKCHGPFFYCSEKRYLIINDRRPFGVVGCNRGKKK